MFFMYLVEDFSPKVIPFTICANSTTPEQDVVITVDDDMFEPVEEGFRLVLVVNESVTPHSQVSFPTGKQVALFRIVDYTDSKCVTDNKYSLYCYKPLLLFLKL